MLITRRELLRLGQVALAWRLLLAADRAAADTLEESLAELQGPEGRAPVRDVADEERQVRDLHADARHGVVRILLERALRGLAYGRELLLEVHPEQLDDRVEVQARAVQGSDERADVLHRVLLGAERRDARGRDRERQRVVHRDLHLAPLPLGGRIVASRQRIAPEPVGAEDNEAVARHAHDDRPGPQRGLAGSRFDGEDPEEGQSEENAPSLHEYH